MDIVRLNLIKLVALKQLSGINKLQVQEWNCMLRSDIKAIPRCFHFKNNMDISGLGSLDSFRSQQTRQVVLGLLLLIFAKLIVQPPLFLNSFILLPMSPCLQGMEEVELFPRAIWNMFKSKLCTEDYLKNELGEILENTGNWIYIRELRLTSTVEIPRAR